MVRAPRPFICSKYNSDFTSRRKIRTSSGFTSAPVAIMSTVTAMRGLQSLRKARISASGSPPSVR
jgi:hypothetical protein